MDFFKDILKTKTFTQSSLTMGGTILNSLLGMIFFILVARNLGSYQFGIFSVTLAMITLVADIGNLGTDTGLIRFIGKYWPGEKEKALRFLKLGFEVKLFVWLLILLLGFNLVPIIVEKIFQKPELIDPFRMGLIGVGGALFFSFTTSSLQALQKYTKFVLILVGSNYFRLVVSILILGTPLFTLDNTLKIYMIAPFLGFLIGLLFLPNFFKVKNGFAVSSEFFHYNKWIALISLISAVSSRLDIFLTTRFLTIQEVGIYSVATQLNSFLPQVYFALATVAAPKFASFNTLDLAKTYTLKLQKMVLGLCILGLSGILVAYFFIPIFYGQEYQASFVPFAILFIGQLFFLLSLPTHQSIYYYFAKPKIIFLITIFQFFTNLILGVALINQFGINGAALAVLISNVLIFILPSIWVLNKFKK